MAAFPVGSSDLPESTGRIEGFTSTVRDKYGVKILDSIEALCADVDAILLLSLDGRRHLEQIKPVLAAKKPVFLDKPVAASLKEAVEIYKLAASLKVPLFSASAVRWYPGVVEVANSDPSALLGAISYGPAPSLAGHPNLYFYGIHPTEALFTVMGQGCQSVVATITPSATVVTGVWLGGRVGTLHAIHQGAQGYKVVRFGNDQILEQKSLGDYTPMLREIMKFFQTGTAPVTPAQTLEIYGFMEAANQSAEHPGHRVSVRDVLQDAGAPEEWLPPVDVDPTKSAPQAKPAEIRE